MLEHMVLSSEFETVRDPFYSGYLSQDRFEPQQIDMFLVPIYSKIYESAKPSQKHLFQPSPAIRYQNTHSELSSYPKP